MRRLFIMLYALFIYSTLFGQGVAITADGSSPDASAILDIKSTTLGLLIPRMTELERDAISNPATGLTVFQTDNTPDLYMFNGTTWEPAGWSVNNSGWTTGTGTTYTTNNVGIGTSSPADELHVAGNIRMVDGNEGAGRVLTSDANGTASWASPSGGSGTTSTHGEMYEHNARGVYSTIDITTADTYYGWTTASSGNVSNVTFTDNSGGDRFTISQAGTYQVLVSVAFGTQNNTVIIDGGVFRNGTIQTNLKFRRFLSSNDVGSASISGIITLSAGDYLDLRFTSEDSGDQVRISMCNFSIVRIL